MENRRDILARVPVGRALIRLSAPAVVGMMVMASYNMVDTIMIGWGVGSLGIASVAASFPVQFMVNAVGMWLAMGVASLLARSLGAEKQVQAETALANGVTIGLVVCALCWGAGEIFIEPLITFCGATPIMRPLSREYLRITFCGSPAIVLGCIFLNGIRAEGGTRFTMMTQLAAALTNCALDYAFIFWFGWGVAGAAWATVIGQMVMLVFSFAYYLRGHTMVKLNMAYWRPQMVLMKDIVSVGFSDFARIASNCLAIALLMHTAVQYGTELHLAAYGICSRLQTFTVKPIFGLGQGLLPLVGFNYGSGDYDRAKKAVKYAVMSALVFTSAVSLVVMTDPEIFIRFFTDDPELIKASVPAARAMLAMFCLVGVHVVITVMFQALGFAKEAIFLSMCRRLIFLVPLMFILPPLFGILGVFMVYSVSDLLSFLCCLGLLIKHRHVLNKEPALTAQCQGAGD